jgi:hypothetical protein
MVKARKPQREQRAEVPIDGSVARKRSNSTGLMERQFAQ